MAYSIFKIFQDIKNVSIAFKKYNMIKLNFGVRGAAFATGIAQVLSTIFFLSHFLRKKSTLKLVKFKFDFNNFILNFKKNEYQILQRH